MAKTANQLLLILIQITYIQTLNAQDTCKFSGYKGLLWGSSISYVKENYTSNLEPCNDTVVDMNINKGEYCLKEENPGKLISKRSFYFNNGKLFKVTIDFSDLGLLNLSTIKESFFKDFGPTKLKHDTTIITDNENPFFKSTVYREYYTWLNKTASITLSKLRIKMNNKTKVEIKKIIKSLLEYQLQSGSAAGLEDMLFSIMSCAAEGTKLNATFLEKTVEAEISNEDKY